MDFGNYYLSCCIPSLIAYLVCTPLTSDIVLAAALAVGHVERVTLQERFTAFSNVERPLAVEVREVQWRGGGLRGAGDRERSEKIPKVGGCHSHAVSSSPTIMWPSGFESQAHHLSFFNLYYWNHNRIEKTFVCSDVSSDNDLNQLIFIIRNGGVFVVNCDTEHHKQLW